MVLHGSGTNGRDVATLFTGLATRGPAAGVTAVFPDGWQGVWHIARPPRGAPALDDAGFLAALARSVRATPVVLAGISNGAGFAEHVARHGLLRVAGLFLVAGTFREFSRQAQPVPRQRAAVTILAGTADPAAPYQGGPMRMPGAAGWILRRRAARHGDRPSERRAAPVETVARDWAAANAANGAVGAVGAVGEPTAEPLAQVPGDPPVTRLTWSAPGGPPVVLYRIEGGGHGWPGGPQYLPARVIGPVPRRLDATGLLLDLMYQVTARLPPG
jgi:polyhydroxybutyrate depolymerase